MIKRVAWSPDGHTLYAAEQSPEALAYVRSDIVNKSVNTQTVFTADVSGPVFSLPGGELSLALGVETRPRREQRELAREVLRPHVAGLQDQHDADHLD